MVQCGKYLASVLSFGPFLAEDVIYSTSSRQVKLLVLTWMVCRSTYPNNKTRVQRLSCLVVDDGRQLAQLGTIVQHIQKVLSIQVCYTWEQGIIK